MQRMSRANHRATLAALAALLGVTLLLGLSTGNVAQGNFPGVTPTPTCVSPILGMPEPGPMPVVSEMLVSEGVVYGSGLDGADGHGYVYALDGSTGRRLWRYRSRQQPFAPLLVTVTDGVVYLDYDAFGDDRYGVTALDARTGQVLWKRATSHFPYAPAVAAHGVLYALGDLTADDGEARVLYALRASDGKLLWTYRDWPYHLPLSVPTVVGDTAYVFGSSTLSSTQPQVFLSTLYALNASDGTLVWYRQWQLNPYVGGSVPLAVANGVIYTTTQTTHQGAGDVYAVRASDGTVLWHTHAAGIIGNQLAVLGGTIYIPADSFVTTDNAAFYALDAHTGKLRVLFRSGYSPDLLAAWNGALYVKGQDAKDPSSYALYAIDASSGAIRWYYHPERTLPARGLLTAWGPINGVVYANVGEGSGENALYALDAGTGKALWRAARDVTGIAQTASNGRVFIASGSYRLDPCTPPSGVGYVYALDAGTGAVLWRYQTGTQMR